MKLNDLAPNPGARHRRKRVGRGTGSGSGKTSGRGTKGQGARSGGGKGPYFEGGQLPLARRLPFKRGFTNIRRIEYKPVNIYQLAEMDFGGETVTPELMAEKGLLKKATDPVVILGDGELKSAVTVMAHRFSKSAKEKIEAAGGKVVIVGEDGE
ncbi:MAG: 50S ribosomal protein L15 [Chloroflexota bacterium]